MGLKLLLIASLSPDYNGVRQVGVGALAIDHISGSLLKLRVPELSFSAIWRHESSQASG